VIDILGSGATALQTAAARLISDSRAADRARA
jgi:hypothetical protein